MLKSLLTILTLASGISAAFAQDIITKKSGEGVKAKVLEITTTEIRYKRFDNQEGPVYTIPKSEVLLVRYENNTEEIFTGNDSFIQGSAKPEAVVKPEFTAKPATTVNTESTLRRDPYTQGQEDAAKHYQSYRGAGTGVLIGSLLSPLIGLAPAIICSTSKPKEHNLDYPNHELMQNTAYNTGYTNKARKIKSQKVWRNWGIGLGVNIALAVALSK